MPMSVPRGASGKPSRDGATGARDPLEDAYESLFPGSAAGWCAVVATVSLAVAVRQSVAAHPHSGMGKPPMYGDYEAQRHWMEVTVNLPISDWYRQTPDNDLQYWGLDYPPLTAYVSWAFGKLAEVVEPGLVALHTSRGYEEPSGRLFMRLSVLFCDMIMFFTGIYAAVSALYGTCRPKTRAAAALFLLLQPGFILVDHGHFQYNCVCHGLVLWAVALILRGYPRLGSVAYVLALTFKQMTLYYALAFFTFLLAGSLQRSGSVLSKAARVVGLGAAVATTFAVVLAPVATNLDALAQVAHRVFPVARGLFEDKVANFWCATNLVVKWKRLPQQLLLPLSLAATLVGLLPAVLHCFLRPTKDRFVLTLFSCSLSFFLFSFQVHEKSILLPMLPLSLLYPRAPILTTAAGIVSTFSMFPLLRRDGLTVPYASFQLALATLGGYLVAAKSTRDQEPLSFIGPASQTTAIARAYFKLTVSGVVFVHVLEATLPAFERYPDINTYLYVLLSAFHFLGCWLLLFVNDAVQVARILGRSKRKKE